MCGGDFQTLRIPSSSVALDDSESAWEVWHKVFNLAGRGDNTDWVLLYREALAARGPKSPPYQAHLLVDLYAWYIAPQPFQTRVFGEIERHAASGIPWAMCKMGSAFFHGIVVERDWTEACCWYTKAADADQAEAQCRLAGLIRASIAPSRDMERAAALYLRVATKPHSAWRKEARVSVSELYAFGMGVPEDCYMARYLIEPMLRLGIRADPWWPRIERVARRIGLLPV